MQLSSEQVQGCGCQLASDPMTRTPDQGLGLQEQARGKASLVWSSNKKVSM